MPGMTSYSYVSGFSISVMQGSPLAPTAWHAVPLAPIQVHCTDSGEDSCCQCYCLCKRLCSLCACFVSHSAMSGSEGCI